MPIDWNKYGINDSNESTTKTSVDFSRYIDTSPSFSLAEQELSSKKANQEVLDNLDRSAASPGEAANNDSTPNKIGSFLSHLGQSFSPSKALQGLEKLASGDVGPDSIKNANPIELLNQGVDKVEQLTGLDRIRGALQGLSNPNLQPDIPQTDNSYLGNIKNLLANAGQALKSEGQSIVQGFQHPEETRTRFNESLDKATQNMDPVTRLALNIEANAGTDPINVFPLDAAVLRGAKALNTARDVSLVPKSLQADKTVVRGAGDVTTTPEIVSSTPTISEQVKPEITPEIAIPPEELPSKTNFLHSLFGDHGLGITPFGSTKSNRMVSTEQQIVSNPLKSNVQGVIDNAKKLVRTGYQQSVDYLSPLKTINKETYNTAMDASRANNVANTIIRDKLVDLQGNVVGPSLNDVMKESRALGKKVDDYLVLRHAITRMERGEKVYDETLKMTPDKAREAVKRLEQRYPQLENIGKTWDAFNTQLPYVMGVKEGLLSKEAFDAMKQENPNYASMKRQFTLGEKLDQPKFSGSGYAFSGQNAPIKSLSPTGSTRKIVSPIRSAIEQTYAWTNAALRNRTMQEVVKAIQTDPEGMKGIAEIVKKPSTSYKSLDDALREGGSEEFLQQLDNDYKSLFKPAKTGEENIVRAMVNGNPVYVQVKNPEAVKALLGLGSESSGIILKTLQKLSNATKRGATGLFAPMFAVKNLTADAVQAAVQSQNAVKHLAVDLPYALVSSIGEALHIPGLQNLAVDFRRVGGEYSSLLRGDRQLNTSVNSLRRPAFLSPEGIAKGAVTGVKAPFKALEKMSDITENANRMAAYRRNLVGKERTPENVRNAVNAAREATVNFSRKGSMARQTEAFIPYNNAAIQSIYRLAKNFSNPKTAIKTISAAGLLVMAPKLYEYAKFRNDPDYNNLPARERYRNLIYSKNADGTFNKLPMPPEFEGISAFFTDVLRRVIDDNPQAFNGSLDALANAYTPPAVTGALQGATQGGGIDKSLAGLANSTVFAPYSALNANQSFTGAPIEPRSVADRSPANRYDDRTSAVAKWLGQNTGWSPMKIDYLLRSYGGDPARLLLPLTSNVGGGMQKQTLLKNFIVDPKYTNTLATDFYNMKDKVTQARADAREAGKPLPSWYSEELYKELTSTAKGKVSKQLQELSDQKNKINADNTIPKDRKSAMLRDVQAQINNIYLDINSQLRAAGIPK